MATKFNEFADLILQIPGISNYILVRKDGHIIVHDFKNPESLSTSIIYSGLSCEAIKPMMGLSYFKYLGYTLKNNEKLLVFPLGKYFLGIAHEADAYTPDIVDEVTRIIDSITPKKSI